MLVLHDPPERLPLFFQRDVFAVDVVAVKRNRHVVAAMPPLFQPVKEVVVLAVAQRLVIPSDFSENIGPKQDTGTVFVEGLLVVELGPC